GARVETCGEIHDDAGALSDGFGDELVEHARSHRERPRERALRKILDDRAPAVARESPRERISEERVGALGFQSSEIGNPPRGVRDVAERGSPLQFTPRGMSHAASGRGYGRVARGSSPSTAMESTTPPSAVASVSGTPKNRNGTRSTFARV